VRHAGLSRDLVLEVERRARSRRRARWFRNVQTFREYIWLACSGIVLGRLSSPTIVDAVLDDGLAGFVSSQFPPASAARSTITEPGRISAQPRAR
jgi:hypothetical protein